MKNVCPKTQNTIGEKISRKVVSRLEIRLKNSKLYEFCVILMAHKSRKKSRFAVKMSSLFSGPEEGVYSAAVNPRRWLSFTAVFDKKSSKSDIL